MSTAKFNTWLNPNGTENYKCRAWVNFDGTTTPPTIRASGNVSSVTRISAGNFTVNFTTAMPDVNYSAIGTSGATTNADTVVIPPVGGSFSSNSVDLTILRSGIGQFNAAYVSVTIFR